MSTTNFQDGRTPIVADWLNDVDAHVYDQDAVAHQASNINYTPAGTGATERSVETKLREFVSVKDFGASPSASSAVNDAAFTAALTSIERGTLYIPPGVYNTSATVVIANKNDQNDSTQSNFEIIANGAKIVSAVSGSTPAIQISQCKRLKIVGLEVSAPSTSITVDVQGMWNSTWSECLFGTVSFGGSGAFDSHYWNRFEKCQFGALSIDTGVTGGDRSEFNANTFDTCRLWGTDYAVKKYGSHSMEDVVFLNCDVSYQSTAILYVDEPCFGSITFVGGYFDSASGMPADTKGLRVNVIGPVWNPNSANVGNYLLANGSATECRGTGGIRTGQRSPMSSINLMRNGDFKAGIFGIATSNATATRTAGFPSLNGAYIKLASSTAFGSAAFTSIPVPFTGTYTLTVIGRVNTSNTSVNSFAGVYGVVGLSSNWSVSSYSVVLTEGTVQTLTFTNGASGSFDIDIAYVGLTYGGVGQLYAPLHQLADLSSQGNLAGTKLTSSKSATIVSVDMSASEWTAVSFDVTLGFADTSYPQYTAVRTYRCHVVRANGRAAVGNATSISSLSDQLDTVPTISLTPSVSSNVVTFTSSVSLTVDSGEAWVQYQVSNIFNPTSRTITML